jgi:hypothetical protein
VRRRRGTWIYRVLDSTRAARELWAVLEDDEPSVTTQVSVSGNVRMTVDLGA